jgi:CHASE2 domain-containing sensor protein/tRNA A-37 threonylcarbamoyl transferase component Bud32
MPPSSPPTETMTLSQSALGRLAQGWRRWFSGSRAAMQGITTVLWVGTGLLIATHPPAIQKAERQIQGLFWQWRGPVSPPNNVVILAIDEPTLNQISVWPLRRAKYAEVIDRVMQAGARAVAVDIIWDFPSSYGTEVASADCQDVKISADDRALLDVLKKYKERVVLASRFEDSKGEGWNSLRLALPYCPYQEVGAYFGNVNFLKEPDDRVHKLGQEYLNHLVKQDPKTYQDLIQDANLRSFAEASLKAADWAEPRKFQQETFFYGPEETFRHYSFADVITPQNWQSTLEKGAVFKDKLVLIGLTAPNPGDFVETAIGRMPGVEFHANAIGTLLEGRSSQPLLPSWPLGGLIAGLGLLGSLVLARRPCRPGVYLGLGLGLSGGWLLASYGGFIAGRRLPTLPPMLALGLTGGTYMAGSLFQRGQQQRQLQSKILDQARVPEIQALINSESSLQQQLQARQLQLLGSHIGGRYRIIKLLGSGGFGETYIAEDLQRPGTPECVVKQLSPTSNSPKHLKLASKLFRREAETLEKLGEHDQIPRLLAYFEEDTEFYLVQEFVAGQPLSEEVSLGRQLPEVQVIAILRELLQILTFVHSQNVIHRDIKPSNIIRRAFDGRLVLIDFGAVKAVQEVGEEDRRSDLTIGIGTQGYMAPEQQLGQPRFNSDLYAVGMLGVQAITGVSPSQLKVNPKTEEIEWIEQNHASQGMIQILKRLIARSHKTRYQSTEEVLQELRQLSPFATLPAFLDEVLQDSTLGEEDFQETRPWPNSFEGEGDEADLPPTEPPQF